MTKLRFRVGQFEVECDGSDEFLEERLPAIVQALLEMRGMPPVTEEEAPTLAPTRSTGGLPPSVSTVAAAIGAKSGSDLVLAAAASLVLGGNESFSRADLLAAMQSAKAYYKATYRSNLSSYIVTLVKSQHLLDHGNDAFGLHVERRNELLNRLAPQGAGA